MNFKEIDREMEKLHKKFFEAWQEERDSVIEHYQHIITNCTLGIFFTLFLFGYVLGLVF